MEVGAEVEPRLRPDLGRRVERVADSCGYGVPLMRYEGTRSQQMDWYQSRLRNYGANGVLDYAVESNAASLDGLPGLEVEKLPSRA